VGKDSPDVRITPRSASFRLGTSFPGRRYLDLDALLGLLGSDLRSCAERAARESFARGFKNPKARRAIAELERLLGEAKAIEAVEALATTSFMAGSKDAGELAEVRIGSKWITDEGGRKRLVVPRDLPREVAHRWLQQRAKRVAQELLREMAPSREHGGRLPDEDPDAATPAAYLRRAHGADVERRLGEVEQGALATRASEQALFAATRSEPDRQLARLVLEDTPDREIAAALGISHGAARTRKHRLRRRAGLIR